ncbi:MAG: HAMP domain-containing histidine kinase [Bacteroidia bacterium]|nr:HAMP domain-containing histidine kinase [Bacteroidia bacterium]MDW8417649.1 HAMP domain-containing sensor histidine kinase [Bacteroidia bacterium]
MRRWALRIGVASGILAGITALVNELSPIRWHYKIFQWWAVGLWQRKVYYTLSRLYAYREDTQNWNNETDVLFLEYSSSEEQIRRWNTTRWPFPQNKPSLATPDPEIIADEYTLYYALKLFVDTLRQVALIPVRTHPGALTIHERWDFPLHGDKEWIQGLCLRLSGEGLPIVLPDQKDQPLLRFYIGCPENLRVPLRWFYTIVFGISLGLLLLCLWFYLEANYKAAPIIYLGVLIATWLALHWSRLPGRLINSDFFSSANCAISPIHTSLWDIGWNIVILFWITIILRRIDHAPKWLYPMGYWGIWSILGGALYLISKHSQIEIDPVRKLSLFQLAGWGLILAMLRRSIAHFQKHVKGHFFVHATISAIAAVALKLIGLKIWAIIPIVLLYLLPLNPKGIPSYIRYTLVFFLLTWGINGWIGWGQEQRSRFLAEAYALHVARLREPAMEYRLSQILPRITADSTLWNTVKLEDYLIDARFIGNLIRRHLFTLGNDYEVVVSCWQKEGSRADNLFELRPLNWRQVKSRAISVPFAPHLYFINQGIPRYIYVARLPVQVRDIPPLEVQIELYPRSQPLLGRLQAIDEPSLPNYGLYEQGHLIRWWGDERFPAFVSMPSQSLPIWRQADSKYEYIAPISPTLTVYLRLPARNWTAHFATVPIFLALLFLGLLFERFSKIKSIITALYTRNASFVQRFQVLLGVLVFLPLLAILVVTFFLFLRISENQRQQDLTQRLTTVSSYLSGETILLEKLAFWLQNYMAGEESFVRDLMRRIGSLSQSEAFIYTSQGYLYSSTLPVAYWNNLVSPFIEPHILSQMQQVSAGPVIEMDRARKRLMGYAPIRTETGKLLGILHIPQPLPEKSFYEPLWYFIGYTVNAYLFLSLSSIMVGLLLTERFSNSLQKVVMRLRAAPESPNPPLLSWEGGKDEIATLVSAYNEMVERLYSSQRQLERTLRRVSQQEMAFQAAHEIKTALTPLKIHLQHLQRMPTVDPEKLRDISTRLLQRIESLVRIANAFMSFAKLGSTEELPLQPIHLNTALEELLHPFTQNPHVAFDIQLPEEPLWIEGNPDALQQILNNLIQNALQALEGATAPHIQVSLTRSKDEAIIAIQDNGPGIPAEVRERIFEFYFTTRRTGTGLGLAITKGLVERMGGKISFTTEVAKGTTFYVAFPLRPTNGIQNDQPIFEEHA